MTLKRLLTTPAAWIAPILLVFLIMAWQAESVAQKEERNGKARKKARQAPSLPITKPVAELDHPERHEDFPAMCLNAEGTPVVVYIEHEGDADVLKLAQHQPNGELKAFGAVSGAGITNITQPCLTRLPNGRLFCAWSQLEEDGQWDLMGRVIGRRGKAVLGEPIRLSEGSGNDIFPDLGTDRHGRVWLTWQHLEDGVSRIMSRHAINEAVGDGAVTWAETVTVTTGEEGGDWEPRLAFGRDEEAIVIFDSYRRGDFDLYFTRIGTGGDVADPIALARTDRYEARGEAAASMEGDALWVVYEDGITRWGKDLGAEWRKKGGGLHHDRQLKLLRVDLGTNAIEKVADVTALLPDLVADPQSVGTGAIDVPEIIVDREGHPWVFFRYCLFNSPGYWQIAYARLDPETKAWTRPEILGNSAFCLDRRSPVALEPSSGKLMVAYASDLRKNKQAGDSGIYLASIDPADERASVGEMPFDLVQPAPSLLKPYNDTPERHRDDRHTWKIDGETYRLVWGDVHRHTDFSNCRTTDDGCITEHFRYAIEAGGLDFLGTSDHTEVGKRYTSYEWWQTQKLADLFHNPGSFVSLYAYEREQKFPYGHRNVLFLERGGPLIYIKRKNYTDHTRGALALPQPDGDIIGDIPPWQLWDLLRAHGRRKD